MNKDLINSMKNTFDYKYLKNKENESAKSNNSIYHLPQPL